MSSRSATSRVDAVARSALSEKPLRHYTAYKERLLAEGNDDASIASTLSILVWEMSPQQAAHVQQQTVGVRTHDVAAT